MEHVARRSFDKLMENIFVSTLWILLSNCLVLNMDYATILVINMKYGNLKRMHNIFFNLQQADSSQGIKKCTLQF